MLQGKDKSIINTRGSGRGGARGRRPQRTRNSLPLSSRAERVCPKPPQPAAPSCSPGFGQLPAHVCFELKAHLAKGKAPPGSDRHHASVAGVALMPPEREQASREPHVHWWGLGHISARSEHVTLFKWPPAQLRERNGHRFSTRWRIGLTLSGLEMMHRRWTSQGHLGSRAKNGCGLPQFSLESDLSVSQGPVSGCQDNTWVSVRTHTHTHTWTAHMSFAASNAKFSRKQDSWKRRPGTGTQGVRLWRPGREPMPLFVPCSFVLGKSLGSSITNVVWAQHKENNSNS